MTEERTAMPTQKARQMANSTMLRPAWSRNPEKPLGAASAELMCAAAAASSTSHVVGSLRESREGQHHGNACPLLFHLSYL